MTQKLLIVNAAALGWRLVQRQPPPAPLVFQPLESVFPAVTCPAQAAFRTGLSPAACGAESNGLFLRDLRKVSFWEQSAALVRGPRIWEQFRARGKKVGLMFWQQSLGEQADLLLSPKPIHKHHGGMIQDCYSQPHDLYSRLVAAVGRPFNLMHYWGPLASHKASDWITDATCAVMAAPDLAPDLLLTYLPHLDYDLQRYGPESSQAFQALEKSYVHFSKLWKTAAATGYDVVIFGDYAIEAVTGAPIFPNRVLRAANLLQVRQVGGRTYHDLFTSVAFAVCDHQGAHVIVLDGARRAAVRTVLEKLDGVDEIIERGADCLVTAKPGRWFAYPWWESKREAPDYAGHVDIHNKPGYDPCELFWGWSRLGGISQDAARIRGTHGLVGAGREVAWASSLPFSKPAALLDLAQQLKIRLNTV
ncbi:MAG: alkaline phosphatase family protein [Verrucomicrobia bacterium]|nr:MAG: alkaline phosphatase family protein [Verrucomicrobiota bacterium]